MTNLTRCVWCEGHQVMQDYHDTEWGLYVTDDSMQFEHHLMEVFQAGLSWLTMLNKRENFRAAFAGFDPEKVARFNDKDVARLLGDAGIIRNRQKIAAAINNAPLFMEISAKYHGFHNFLDLYRIEKPRIYSSEGEIPGKTAEAEALSKELKRIGFKFVGPTICYAHMQAVGIVNDHVKECFRFEACNK